MTIEIGLVFAVIAGVIGVATFIAGKQSTAKNDGHEWGAFQAELRTDIGYIKRDVGEIKVSVGESNQELKASIRRIHRRIDDHLRNDHHLTVQSHDMEE